MSTFHLLEVTAQITLVEVGEHGARKILSEPVVIAAAGLASYPATVFAELERLNAQAAEDAAVEAGPPLPEGAESIRATAPQATNNGAAREPVTP